MPKATSGGASNAWEPAEDAPVAEEAVVADAAAAVLPPERAPKADWVDHAVNVAGIAPEQAQSMTKPELVETVKAAVPPPPPPPPAGS
jgi:hypothetical protein